jgi:hypothetical protein
VGLIGDGEFEIVRPPLPFARPRRTEISRVGDESISTNVAPCKIDSGRHRGAIESAALAGWIRIGAFVVLSSE